MALESLTKIFVNYNTAEIPFITIAVFLLIFLFILMAFKRISLFKGNPGIGMLISIIIAVLSTRYLNETLLSQGVLLPYTALGLILILGLPFALIALFTHRTKMNVMGRKTVWAIYAIVFSYVWYTRYETFSTIQTYISIINAALIALMIFADKMMHDIFKKRD